MWHACLRGMWGTTQVADELACFSKTHFIGKDAALLALVVQQHEEVDASQLVRLQVARSWPACSFQGAARHQIGWPCGAALPCAVLPAPLQKCHEQGKAPKTPPACSCSTHTILHTLAVAACMHACAQPSLSG